MNNEELIKAVRYCVQSQNCWGCDLLISHNGVLTCKARGKKALLLAAADALEAADKRIADLEARMPKLPDRQEFLAKGSYIKDPLIRPNRIMGYDAEELILFAKMCKENDVTEHDLKQAAWNLELAVRAVMHERQEVVKNTMDVITIRFTPDFEKAYAEMRGENDEQIH